MRELGQIGPERVRRLGVVSVLVAVLAAGLLSAGGSPADAAVPKKASKCPKARASFDKLKQGKARKAVLCIVNVERKSRGLRTLKLDKRLAASARSHSAYQYSLDELTHSGPNGSDTGDRIEKEGYEWRTWGENVAWNYGSALDVMKGWMGSEGHCRNILSPDFTDFGFGVKNGSKGPYMTQVFAAEPNDPPPAGGNGPQNSCPQ